MIKLEIQLFASGGDEAAKWPKPTNYENDTQWKSYLKTQYPLEAPKIYNPAQNVLFELNDIDTNTISKKALNLYLRKHFVYSLDNTDIYIPPFDIEKNDNDTLYFSCKIKNIINYGYFLIDVIQLKGKFEDYNNVNSKEWISDNILNVTTIHPTPNLLNTDDFLEYKTNILKDENTTQICLKIHTETSPYYDMFTEQEANDMIKKINPLLNPFDDFVYATWSLDHWTRLFQSQFKESVLTYLISDEVPVIDENDIDFSELWLCDTDIYDEEDNLLYQKDKLYTIDTSTTPNKWTETEYTKDQLDETVRIVSFSHWKEVKQVVAMTELNDTAELTATISDMMLAFTDSTWQPAQGENFWGKNIKISGEKGIYIYNTVDGYNRIIDEKQDVSKDNNGGINWMLTVDGQLVKNQEITGTLKQGHIVIVPGEDGNRYYYV